MSLSTVHRCITLRRPLIASKLEPLLGPPPPPPPLYYLSRRLPFSCYLSVELKVEMVGIHEKRLRKCLSKLKGIEKVEVDANSQKVVVTGYAHRNKILKAVRRGGLKADFWSAQNELLNVYAGVAHGNFRFTTSFNFF
ncbi:hypothetical protein TIFTF001_004841 [Ficus carica]|uniref:HMA domain-containing protein n=1 Tax=Ficus carica TaxID=3494 RepID=A0AA88CYJ2_FICCA|nr:hypothetical protein TIFTF001_004841 [Ficus carica]